QIVRPKHLAIDRAKAKELEISPQDINTIAHDRRRGARAIAALVFENRLVDLAMPDFLAIVGVEADAFFIAVALHHQIAALGDDGDGPKRLANRHFPDDF